MLLLERTKLVVEGAGAVGVAALRQRRVEPAASGTTVVVLSGGNIDTGVLADIARHHETERGPAPARSSPRSPTSPGPWPPCSPGSAREAPT